MQAKEGSTEFILEMKPPVTKQRIQVQDYVFVYTSFSFFTKYCYSTKKKNVRTLGTKIDCHLQNYPLLRAQTSS